MALERASSFNEKKASRIFRNIILALQHIHDVGKMINCDIKAENVVFSRSDPTDNHVKLIDFGAALEMPTGGSRAISNRLFGTAGLYAPETIRSVPGNFVYSAKTDIWQTGCLLYIMLHGYLPFGNSHESHGKIGGPLPSHEIMYSMREDLSIEAKDLILRIFNKDPELRLSIPEILSHPWVANAATVSETDFGLEYKRRIGAWENRRIIKRAMRGHIETSLLQKEQIIRYVLEQSPSEDTFITTDMFKVLQARFFSLAKDRHIRAISFEEYGAIVSNGGAKWLADPKVYSIFDLDQNGSIDYFEFIISLIPFRPEYDRGNVADFYFEVFDLNGDGVISISEFEYALQLFLLEADCSFIADQLASMVLFADISETDSEKDLHKRRKITSTSGTDGIINTLSDEKNSELSIDSIFATVDIDGDGLISLAEFRQFFTAVNVSTMATLC